MPASWKEWTPNEEAQLAAWRTERIPQAMMAERLQRPIYSIRHKMHRLALPKPLRRIRRWCSWETGRLKRVYVEVERTDELQKLFPGRTLDAIHLKAKKLGLQRTTRIRTLKHDADMLRRIRDLSQWKLGYIAGIVDGEGTVSRKNGIVKLSVGSSTFVLIEWLHVEVGGNVHVAKPLPNHKPFWIWTLTQTRACELLLQRTAPFLLIKSL